MVSTASLICMGITGLLSVVFPVVLTVVLLARRAVGLREVGVGALVFFLVQVVFRLNLLSLLSLLPSWRAFASDFMPLYLLILSLTAGLVEEWGRYFGYRLLLKGRTSWRTGLGYGLGHGGFESLFLMGTTTFNNILLSLAINLGILESLMPGAGYLTISQLRNTLVTTQPALFLLGGVERVFALGLQLALSQMVLQGVRQNRKWMVWEAVALHTLFNFPAALLSALGEPYWAELVIAISAAGSVVYLWRARKTAKKEGWL